jgi:hypothetical protein
MIKFVLAKSFLFALFLCLGAANLPAQQAEMIPPPISSVIPPEPPDPDTLPPPPQLEWEPLAPKDSVEQSSGAAAVAVPPPLPEAPIAPPPPPVTEPLLAGPPDPADAEAAKAEVEVWRPESESPQIPARSFNRLAPAYVTGDALVTLRVQFDPAAAGKTVYARPGRGITIGDNGGVRTISPTGECVIAVQLAPGCPRSHIIFYCNGVRTALPVVRAPLAVVIEAEGETGGGH